jgi:hypothetical protein
MVTSTLQPTEFSKAAVPPAFATTHGERVRPLQVHLERG